ncbi:hypothetical protein PFL02_13150 [Pseudomonas fluorescens]|nr:hypothetical protein PFL02_13150 [Pseudomonas fluorescens]
MECSLPGAGLAVEGRATSASTGGAALAYSGNKAEASKSAGKVACMSKDLWRSLYEVGGEPCRLNLAKVMAVCQL